MAAAAAGSTLLVACEDARPSDGAFKAQGAGSAAAPLDPVTALNTVLAIEHQAIYAYTTLAPKLTTPAVLALATGFLKDHTAHRDALIGKVGSLGGTPVPAKATYDLSPAPTTEAQVVKAAAGLEALAAATYFKLLPGLGDPALLAFLATIMGDEAQHAAVLEAALGKPPVPGSFQGANAESVA